MFNWSRKYKSNRNAWAERRGLEALELIDDGGKSKKQLMKEMVLAEDSLERVLKTIRPKIWLVGLGKYGKYERRPE